MKLPLASNKLDSLDLSLSPRPGRPNYIVSAKVTSATDNTITIDYSSKNFSLPPQLVSAVYGVAVADTVDNGSTASGTITLLGVSCGKKNAVVKLTGTSLDTTNGYVQLVLQAFA